MTRIEFVALVIFVLFLAMTFVGLPIWWLVMGEWIPAVIVFGVASFIGLLYGLAAVLGLERG